MDEKKWTEVANVGDVDDEEAIQVIIDGDKLALFFVDGEYYATDDCCTHEEASLAEGYVDGATVECPLHQGVFCLKSGKALQPPVETDVVIYPVKTAGTKILIQK